MNNDSYDTIVLNGTLVNCHGGIKADIAISKDKIIRIENDLSNQSATKRIDATGKLVLPGIIDVHNHPVYDDDMEGTSLSAVHGGVTTLIPFIGPNPAWGLEVSSLTDTLKKFIDEAPAHSLIDFALHGVFIGHDNLVPQIPSILKLGVNSIKFFMMYKKRGMMVEDEDILRIMDALASNDALSMVHAENGPAVDYLWEKQVANGNVGNDVFIEVHRDLLEAEAILRAVALAESVRCPLYIPHIAVKEGIDILRRIKHSLRMPLFMETCPHYLLLTNDEVLKRGALAKIAPPIREVHDSEALWSALRDGFINTVGTDHAAIKKEKKIKSNHILDAPYGAPGIELLLPLMYSEGVRKGRISLGRMVQVLCENPAKIFGLFPKKGALVPGADADLVVFNSEKKQVCKAETQHSNAGFCLYEGIETTGAPEIVMQRGKILLEEGNLNAQFGDGRYLPAGERHWNDIN